MDPKIETLPLWKLHRAKYNPRTIDEESRRALTDSISRLGIIKPLVTRYHDHLILAGHQRSDVARAMGMKEVPVFRVKGLNSADEVRFNQLHNLTEVNEEEHAPVILCDIPFNYEGTGFLTLPSKCVHIMDEGEYGAKVYTLATMIQRFGQFANAVCSPDGFVIVSPLYAKAVKLLRLPLMVYVADWDDCDYIRQAFTRQYGQFCYDRVKRQTYVQSMAQKFRLRANDNGRPALSDNMRSVLYEKVVLPKVNKKMRILDFGAGQKDYVSMLSANGYDIDGLEFYHRMDDSLAIDIEEVTADVWLMLRHLRKFGGYDVVVCDSVLNSVDSIEAERNVLLTLSALCKPGGWIFLSGMPVRRATTSNNQKTITSIHNLMSFLDADNFSANIRPEGWFFQHYHSMDGLRDELHQTIGSDPVFFSDGQMHGPESHAFRGGTWQVAVQNERPAALDDILSAVRFEFSLPLPSGKRYHFSERVLKVVRELLSSTEIEEK